MVLSAELYARDLASRLPALHQSDFLQRVPFRTTCVVVRELVSRVTDVTLSCAPSKCRNNVHLIGLLRHAQSFFHGS